MKYEELDNWLKEGQAIAPDIVDWIGIYFKTSFLNGEDSTDLVLGPYIGEETEHTRIPLSKGMCGLALRDVGSLRADH